MWQYPFALFPLCYKSLLLCGRGLQVSTGRALFSLRVSSISSSLSSVGERGSSPCSMPLWSRSCCMNRAWPLLPRSWQNLKLSREVFANQHLIKAEKNLCATFQLKSVKWNGHFSVCVTFFSLSHSLLDSFHQRPDRRSRWWVDHLLLLCPKTVVLKFAEITVILTLLFCANASYLWEVW